MKDKSSSSGRSMLVNPYVQHVRYEVRGPIVTRAEQLEQDIKNGVKKPFNQVVRASIGDSQAMGQKPFTYIRQMQALVSYPPLLNLDMFPEDVKRRARYILQGCSKGSVGAYSCSAGLPIVREAAAKWLTARDGLPTHIENLFLGAGATDLIYTVLTLHANTRDSKGRPPAVMTSSPQYPLFTSALGELGLKEASYVLDAEDGWKITEEELLRCWTSISRTHNVVAIVMVNPGNPTGQVMSTEEMQIAIRFAHDHDLMLLADEVYQENIVHKEFVSFKKMCHCMGAPYDSISLASVLTLSKGWSLECGARGGLMELNHFPTNAMDAFHRLRAVRQCAPILGQIALYCVMDRPRPGDESFDVFQEEMRETKQVLRDRCVEATRLLNAIPGYKCSIIDGSMFAFPRVHLPQRAIEDAAAQLLQPDEMYCLQLLEATGVCVVPGRGFKPVDGQFFFRTTILHPHDEFLHIMNSFQIFHQTFLEKYRD